MEIRQLYPKIIVLVAGSRCSFRFRFQLDNPTSQKRRMYDRSRVSRCSPANLHYPRSMARRGHVRCQIFRRWNKHAAHRLRSRIPRRSSTRELECNEKTEPGEHYSINENSRNIRRPTVFIRRFQKHFRNGRGRVNYKSINPNLYFRRSRCKNRRVYLRHQVRFILRGIQRSMEQIKESNGYL